MTNPAGGPGSQVTGPPPRYMPPQQRPTMPQQQQQQQQPPQTMPSHMTAAANQVQSIPSPGAPPMGFVPSPAGAGTNPNMMAAVANQAMSPMSNPRSTGPAPGTMAPLPMSPMSTSIGTPSDDDHAYSEKVKQLNKYIEPLRQMIAGINKAEKQKLSKMNTLMEILSNPNKRTTPMETLMKCETVLENMLNKNKSDGSQQHQVSLSSDHTHIGSGGGGGGSSSGAGGTGGMNPLLDAIFKLRNAEQKNQTGSSLNHTLNRSLRAPLEAVFGTEITLPPLPKKMRKTASSGIDDLSENNISGSGAVNNQVDIPDVLQGEVARLQPQFKVSLDPAQPTHFSNNIMLVCQLEDKDLPSVPPLCVTIPQNYPHAAAPVCGTDEDLFEYQFTPFLNKVKDALQSRLAKMPQRYSLSQLLSAWEMSVRAACSVNKAAATTAAPIAAAARQQLMAS